MTSAISNHSCNTKNEGDNLIFKLLHAAKKVDKWKKFHEPVKIF